MRKLTFGALVGLAASVVPAATSAGQDGAAPRRPNFVFFLTDDQRADALSLAGHPLLKTPNIDRIGREGAWFKNAFTTHSLCSPSRSSYLTGRYTHTTGVLDNGKNNGFVPGQKIVSEHLRDAGYEVAFIGKSHIAGNLRDRKWDHYFGFRGQGTYFDPLISEDGGPDLKRPGYMDDVLGDKAVDYLARPKDKPFCLFVWFKAPHRSWQRAPRYASLYEGLTVPEPPNFKAGFDGKPFAFADTDMQIGKFDDVRDLDHLVKDYFAVVTSVDDNVGKVLKALDDRKLADDTAVIYGSDNGFFLGEWNLFDKRLMHEPSIRVPLLVRYPRIVKPGTVRAEMALNVDVAPTILELAGVANPGDLHGKSFVPLLQGKDVPWRDAWLYEYYEYPQPHHVQPNRGVRTDRYKLIHYYAGTPPEWELYDLQADPNETTNLHGRPEHAELTARLKTRMEELRRETNDPDLGKD